MSLLFAKKRKEKLLGNVEIVEDLWENLRKLMHALGVSC
jgi:hypothetical protein